MSRPRILPVRPHRAVAVLALLLMALIGGLRLGEWTLCFEADGRRHAESSLADCPGDARHEADHAANPDAPVDAGSLEPYDCVSCVDLTFAPTALRQRAETIPSLAVETALDLPATSAPPNFCVLVFRPALPHDPAALPPSLRATDTTVITS